MFDSLELFKISHAMARHAGQRQAIVARNMANSDTPGYQPEDLSSFKKQFQVGAVMKATRDGHLNSTHAGYSNDVVKISNNASSPNGNGVSIEDEMLRAVDVQRQHSRALAVYRHSLTVLRSSLGR